MRGSKPNPGDDDNADADDEVDGDVIPMRCDVMHSQ